MSRTGTREAFVVLSSRPTPRPHTRLGLETTSRSGTTNDASCKGSRPLGKHVSRHLAETQGNLFGLVTTCDDL